MARVSIRDLRDHAADVVDRATRGEEIIVTRSGRDVARLQALSHTPLSAEALLSRWHRLPPVDPVFLRADIDEILDAR
jgi:prevent-host-death family protein